MNAGAARVDKDVLQLDVPVCDLEIVREKQGFEDLVRRFSSFSLCEEPILKYFIIEFFALEEFCDDVVEVWELVELVDLQDVGVVQALENIDFLLLRVLLGKISFDDFEGPDESQYFMLDFENVAIDP